MAKRKKAEPEQEVETPAAEVVAEEPVELPPDPVETKLDIPVNKETASSIKDMKKKMDEWSKSKEKTEKTYVNWDGIDSNKIHRRHTGSYLLDESLGGGWPVGICQLFGARSGGKSAIAQLVCGTVARTEPVMFNDNEYGIAEEYARNTFGFDIRHDHVLYSQEDDMLAVYTMIRKGLEAGIKFFVIDSENGLLTEAEEEAEVGEAMMTQHARLNSQELRYLKSKLFEAKASLIIVSQVRDKIGSYGSGETTTGGNAIPFYSNIIGRVSREDWIKQGDIPIGQRIKVVWHKNKTAPPFRSCSLDLYYGQGIDRDLELVAMVIEKGLVEKSGNWLTVGDHKVNGRGQLAEVLKNNPDLKEELAEKVARMFGA
jgi:recombination protein RecA